MPVQIQVPASEVKNRLGVPLVLENGQLCSRCGQSGADYFEKHRLHYRVGFRSTHLFGKKFRISTNYLLKIRICETCFKSDFLTHPELLDQNNSQLSRIARFHSNAWSMGGLLSALGFLLLTPIIPEVGVLGQIKEIWQIPVIMGVLVLFLTWLSQRKYQSKVLKELEKENPNFIALPRAELHAYILQDEEDPSVAALDVILQNDAWAEECAIKNQWKHEQVLKTH